MTMKTATLTIQKWGNSLAVRLPAPIAKNAHIHTGTMVELTVHEGNIIVKPTGKHKLSLNERLAAFDPNIHGGEVMASKNIGVEKLSDKEDLDT